jgi:hypothetical protein
MFIAISLALLSSPRLSPCAENFSFDSPAGPEFTAEQKRAQREAGSRVVPQVLAAFRAHTDSVRIPAGDYRFGSERWGHDGVVYPLEFGGLRRDDAHPFTIDATGATFWFDLPDDQAPTAHFCVGFKDCRNVIFKGATLDRATRGHIEGRITQFDFAGNRLEIELSPGVTVPDKFNGKLEQRVVPFKADGTFCAPLYALQRGGVHLKYKHISPAAASRRCWVTMQDNQLLNTIRATGLLRVGDGLSCIYAVSAAIELRHCERLTMDGIKVFIPKGWGAEWGGEGGHLWKNCLFGPRPGTSQWQGGEGFMFCATRHGTTLDGIVMRHTGDDIANFHGYWGHVESCVGNRVTFVRSGEFDRTVARDVVPGDRMLFRDRNTGLPLGEARVVRGEGNVVFADRPVAVFANAIVQWPDHECAGWIVRRCTFQDNYQRLLIQSGPGVVGDCVFARQGSGIEINSVMPYVEGGVPRDIRIENNTFTEVNPQPGGAVISVYAHTFQRNQAPTLCNITITGNTFIHPNETVIDLTDVDGGVIAGNHFSGSRRPVRLNRCTNVSVGEQGTHW